MLPSDGLICQSDCGVCSGGGSPRLGSLLWMIISTASKDVTGEQI